MTVTNKQCSRCGRFLLMPDDVQAFTCSSCYRISQKSQEAVEAKAIESELKDRIHKLYEPRELIHDSFQ